MKKQIYLILLTCYMLVVCIGIQTNAVAKGYQAAIVVETNTGEVLYSDHADKILPQASLTKLMTYYTFMKFATETGIDFGKKQVIDVKSFHLPSNGAKIGLSKGDRITIGELITSLFVVSANDSAEELKRIYNHSGRDMITDMNQLSTELGFTRTKFVNVSGLTDEIKDKSIKAPVIKRFNVTTAQELASLSCLILNEYPEVLKTTSKQFCYFKGKQYKSTNKLLKKYRNIDGLKTGSTEEAGYCFAGTLDATALIGLGEKTRLLAIVLGCKDDAARFNEARKLLDQTLDVYVNETVAPMDRPIPIKNEFYKNGIIECLPKTDIHMLKKRNEKTSKVIKFTNKLNGAIHKGEKIGVLTISIGDRKTTTEIFAKEDYDRKSMPVRALIHIRNFFGDLF